MSDADDVAPWSVREDEMFGIYTGSIKMLEGDVPPDLIGASIKRPINGVPGNVNVAKTVMPNFYCKLMVVM